MPAANSFIALLCSHYVDFIDTFRCQYAFLLVCNTCLLVDKTKEACTAKNKISSTTKHAFGECQESEKPQNSALMITWELSSCLIFRTVGQPQSYMCRAFHLAQMWAIKNYNLQLHDASQGQMCALLLACRKASCLFWNIMVTLEVSSKTMMLHL